jgi:hypothetical protein
MHASGALLGDAQLLIHIDYIVRTGLLTQATPLALLWIDPYQSIIPLMDGLFWAYLYARGIVAVLAEKGQMAYANSR